MTTQLKIQIEVNPGTTLLSTRFEWTNSEEAEQERLSRIEAIETVASANGFKKIKGNRVWNWERKNNVPASQNKDASFIDFQFDDGYENAVKEETQKVAEIFENV